MAMAEEEGQAELRLRRFIAAAEWRRLEGEYAYEELPPSIPPALDALTVAAVRDGDRWSRLARLQPESELPLQRWALWSFHFHPGLDGTGFVGWLASQLRTRLGTAVIVVCGSSGGIFDYWGCPVEGAAAVEAEIRALRAAGAEP
jgi:hypothetical protein